MRLLNFLKSIYSKLIPREISPNELAIARAAIEPDHFKNSLLIPYCFMPPGGSTDTSLCRLNYSGEKKAKIDGISLAKNRIGKKFVGLVVINQPLLNQLNQSSDISAVIKGTPIDENFNYILDNRKVFVCDKGLPYHADIVFSKAVVKNEPNTDLREYNEGLVQLVIDKNLFFPDNCPQDEAIWCGTAIVKLMSEG